MPALSPPAVRVARRLGSGLAAGVLAALVAAACPGWARAQDTPDPDDRTPFSEARLAVETQAARAGHPLSVGLVLTLEPGWHTYWKNPGDSGSEAVLEWDLPGGVEAGPIQWPRPELVPYPPLMSYAYHGSVMLLTDLDVDAGVAPGSRLTLGLRASWLVCQEICLPADTVFSVELPVVDGPAAPDPAWASLFAATRALLPLADADWNARALETSAGYTLAITAPADWDERVTDVHFFALDPTAVDHVEPQDPAWDGGMLRLTLARSAYNTGPPTLEGVLVRTDGGGFERPGGGGGAPGAGAPPVRPALAISAPVAEAAAPGGAAATRADQDPAIPDGPGGTGFAGLAVALLLAFAGGVLLNLMPCVFPVLSLKILGFVRQAAGDPSLTRRHGAVFGVGVVASFLALAGVLLAVRAAGSQVGWGFQLQSPPVVALLAVLMFVIGLVMAGVWEPGAALTRLGSVGAGDESLRGSFLTGVLAAVVATPCTAPFMGAAIGVALVRPAAEGLAIFAVLGAGMAAPYMVLSSWPALLERVPRPGPWMDTLKEALSFPMFGVTVWLAWVFGLQTGADGVAGLLAALTLVALGCWIVGHWPAVSVTRRKRMVTRAVALAAFALAAAALVRASRAEPAWRVGSTTAALDGGGGTGSGSGSGAAAPAWEPFGDGSSVAAHRAAGRIVFVDFTAAWCISCQVNERVVLSSEGVMDAFRERNVALLKADWTRRDPEITRALAAFGRSGVPLYVVYSPDPGREPELLPAVLTPGIVLSALERAAAALPAGTPAG